MADERTSWEIHSSDQLLHARDYVPLIVAQAQGAHRAALPMLPA